MSAATKPGKSWMCALGRHHYVVRNDANPENQAGRHLECTKCAKVKDRNEYTKTRGDHLSGGM
jgi:hypothetical protein